jgi:hypothetical protein
MSFSSFSDDEIAMSHQHLRVKKHFSQGNSPAGIDDVCQNPADHLFKLGRSYRITCHIEITQKDERVVNPIWKEIVVSEEVFVRFPAFPSRLLVPFLKNTRVFFNH